MLGVFIYGGLFEKGDFIAGYLTQIFFPLLMYTPADYRCPSRTVRSGYNGGTGGYNIIVYQTSLKINVLSADGYRSYY